MNQAKFYVDYCFEAGSFEGGSGGNVCHRYWFAIDMTDEAFEELYQVWYKNNSQLNSWDTDWDGHDKLFAELNASAIHALNTQLEKHEPEFVNPVDVLWEISKETEDAF